jgi:hypothetical protein
MVLAAGPELIEDIRKAPDNVLSFREPILEVGILCGTKMKAMLTKIILSSFKQNTRLTC